MAEREMKSLARKGERVQPVVIEGRSIARTFWGKAWCDHLESFSDFENRLPRGRTYVRNGSVCHLEILRGAITAKVSGSELYTVDIAIKPLSRPAWNRIKDTCAGSIGSILDLLQGRLSDGVMAVVTDRENGLFPKPREITMKCSCPDWATMCKHVAAVLYGVGARLDVEPRLLFLLRGVDHEELIGAGAEKAVEAVIGAGKRRRIADADLEEVFGVELEEPAAPRARPSAPGVPQRKLPARITGKQVRDLRKRLGVSQKAFAELLDVSPATVSVWEKARTQIRFQVRTQKAFKRAWEKPTG
jgi:uncharacterized Zn finger protein